MFELMCLPQVHWMNNYALKELYTSGAWTLPKGYKIALKFDIRPPLKGVFAIFDVEHMLNGGMPNAPLPEGFFFYDHPFGL